jgi:hypothetical protein
MTSGGKAPLPLYYFVYIKSPTDGKALIGQTDDAETKVEKDSGACMHMAGVWWAELKPL